MTDESAEQMSEKKNEQETAPSSDDELVLDGQTVVNGPSIRPSISADDKDKKK